MILPHFRHCFFAPAPNCEVILFISRLIFSCILRSWIGSYFLCSNMRRIVFCVVKQPCLWLIFCVLTLLSVIDPYCRTFSRASSSILFIIMMPSQLPNFLRWQSLGAVLFCLFLGMWFHLIFLEKSFRAFHKLSRHAFCFWYHFLLYFELRTLVGLLRCQCLGSRIWHGVSWLHCSVFLRFRTKPDCDVCSLYMRDSTP
jgi:hypothetical protein